MNLQFVFFMGENQIGGGGERQRVLPGGKQIPGLKKPGKIKVYVNCNVVTRAQ